MQIEVALEGHSYPIVIEAGASRDARLHTLIEGRSVVIITDPVVAPLYLNSLVTQLARSAAQVLPLVPDLSESNKKLAVVEEIVGAMLAARCDRKTVIVALGGGVVGDVAGFAAAIYQRGIDFVQMPTTLLAMVDSSVGGKTGVNHLLGKNMMGAFYQPRMVLADVDFLQSLPPREVSAGLAEIIKHGAIADADYLAQVAQNIPKLRSLDAGLIQTVIARSCAIKAEIVGRDEREQGIRANLNFGHTFGHAIEAGLGYGEWLHGEAVGAGMVMAAALSVQLGHLNPESATALTETIAAAGLPTRGPNWPPERYQELMSIDKKANQGTPKFILLDGIGKAIIRQAPDFAVQTAIRSCI